MNNSLHIAFFCASLSGLGTAKRARKWKKRSQIGGLQGKGCYWSRPMITHAVTTTRTNTAALTTVVAAVGVGCSGEYEAAKETEGAAEDDGAEPDERYHLRTNSGRLGLVVVCTHSAHLLRSVPWMQSMSSTTHWLWTRRTYGLSSGAIMTAYGTAPCRMP